MSSGAENSPSRRRRPTLAGQVALAPGQGIAYVPGRVLVRGPQAEAQMEAGRGGKSQGRLLPRRQDGTDVGSAADHAQWRVFDEVDDAIATVAVLRADGFVASPDHVLFSHSCDACCAGPHPAMTWDADPYRANPYRANPYRANPYRANPYRANPHRLGDAQTSSALPAAGRLFPERSLIGPGAHPRVVVLDTGLAGGTDENGEVDADHQRPTLLVADPPAPGRISGRVDVPDSTLLLEDGGSTPPDAWLDPVAGHGTFIAGIVEQIAPGCTVRVERVVGPLGEASESEIYKAIMKEAFRPKAERADILSLSFGGPLSDHPTLLRSAIAQARLAGIVVVASAGNDGTSDPQFPAAFPDVIAVGAIGPDGPPEWTNYGEWVDACAPGVDIVSAFFNAFDGPTPSINSIDTDHFTGWARWSGTSFAAPMVVAALAREVVLGACGAEEAVRRIIRAPHLLRIPCLGTVVNI